MCKEVCRFCSRKPLLRRASPNYHGRPANQPANDELARLCPLSLPESAVPRTAYDPRTRRAYRPTSTVFPPKPPPRGIGVGGKGFARGADGAPARGSRVLPLVAAHPKRSKSAAPLTRFRSLSLAAWCTPRSRAASGADGCGGGTFASGRSRDWRLRLGASGEARRRHSPEQSGECLPFIGRGGAPLARNVAVLFGLSRPQPNRTRERISGRTVCESHLIPYLWARTRSRRACSPFTASYWSFKRAKVASASATVVELTGTELLPAIA